MSISPVFGRLFVASQLEDAVMATLKNWFPTYLAEVARQMGMSRNSFPQPQNYLNRNTFFTEAGEEWPKIVVLTPGTIGTAAKDGIGTYRATWRLGVGVACQGKDEESANRAVKAYAAAIKGILEQNASLDGSLPNIVAVTWLSDAYPNIPITNQHQLFKGANCWFAVEMYDVVTDRLGPDAPVIEPAPTFTEVETVIIDVQQEE